MELRRGWETVIQGAKSAQSLWFQRDYSRLENSPSAAPIPVKEVRSVLIYKPDEIGDAIHSLPAISHLRDHYKEAKFYLLCQRGTRSLFEAAFTWEAIAGVKVEKLADRFPRFSVEAALGELGVRAFDLSIFLRTYPSYFRLFRKIPARWQVHPRDPRTPFPEGTPVKVGLWKSPRDSQAKQMLEIAEQVTGVSAGAGYPSFSWKEEDILAVRNLIGEPLKNCFVIHPHSRMETRAYPHWQKLVGWLREKYGLPMVVVGGPEDPPFANEAVIQAAGKLSLAQSGYLFSRAKAFFGNESGPAHWAAALGVPTVTLFGGHSSVEEWAPRGEKHLLLHRSVECSPCHRHYCPGYGVKCLNELTVERVTPQISRFLESHLLRGKRETDSLPSETVSEIHSE